jgi:DNA polymerase III epsilon subunit-like protein
MRVLVFDTETTGLPKTKLLTPEAVSLWPYIVQFSYVIYDVSDNIITHIRDYIVKIPPHILIDEECTGIHGITNEISYSNGEDITEILLRFMGDFRKSDLIIGHNLHFDINMLKIEVLRQIQKLRFEQVEKEYFTQFLNDLQRSNKYYCTMQSSVDLCGISAIDKKGNPYTKFPKLVELHETLFGKMPRNLHNSLNDVLVCLRCYYKMENKVDLLEINPELDYLFQDLELV